MSKFASEAAKVSGPFAFSNRLKNYIKNIFFNLISNYIKNIAALPLGCVDRSLNFRNLIFFSLCLLSEGRSVGLKSGTKTQNSGLF